MPRQELHSEQLPPVQQMPDITDTDAYDGDIVLTEDVLKKEFADALAFMEEPVTIRIEPSMDQNAAQWLSVWVNGRGAEVLINGQWIEWKHLPVAEVLITKRKYIEVIVRAKVNSITTPDMNQAAHVAENNKLARFTTPVHSFSIIEDRNPKGPAWMSELRRRSY